MCLQCKALCGFFTFHNRKRPKIFLSKDYRKDRLRAVLLTVVLCYSRMRCHGSHSRTRICESSALEQSYQCFYYNIDSQRSGKCGVWSGKLWYLTLPERRAWSKRKWWLEINPHVRLWSRSFWWARILIKCWCKHKVTSGLFRSSHTCRQSHIKEETASCLPAHCLQTCNRMSVRQYWQSVLLIEDNFNFEEV